MRYVIDNDLHIHSKISSCSNDPLQTPERILQYAKENGLGTICLTDHFWDDKISGASDWYAPQNYEHISGALPLPQNEGVRFLFGCETEMDKSFRLGIASDSFDKFDFVIIPTTHLHMMGFTISENVTLPKDKAECWLERFERVLDMDLPFHKVGIAHLTCGLIAPVREQYLETLEFLADNDLRKVFCKAAQRGVGIEVNADDMSFAPQETDTVLRIYRIAKAEGCKFYLGSDAHHPNSLDTASGFFDRAIELLNLTENDKFILK